MSKRKTENAAFVRELRRYIRKHNIRRAPAGLTSPYELVAQHLVDQGQHKPFGQSAKAFVRQLRHLITRGDEPTTPKPPKPARQNAASTTQQHVDTDAFLTSAAWRRTRMHVLKRDGRICACCGATAANGEVMNVDHIKPRKLFPELALDETNLQVLCGTCNHGKGNWDNTDWRTPELELEAVEDVLYGLRNLDLNTTRQQIKQLKIHELQACMLYVVRSINDNTGSPDEPDKTER